MRRREAQRRVRIKKKDGDEMKDFLDIHQGEGTDFVLFSENKYKKVSLDVK
jgi:hypothetical protein